MILSWPRFLINIMKTNKTLSNQVMEIPKSHNYEFAVETLNNLQSNWQYVQNSSSSPNHNPNQLNVVEKYLKRIGLNEDRLNDLSVIHVAGTKGKGTTCALCESILRAHHFKTGFYSSPHLIEVRERIRINGKPISKNYFAEKFWSIYQILNQQKDNEEDMPLYFRFLTIMAFFIFVEQKVDVAIVEVGIGGEYDCTNILKNVKAVGITSLGMDHLSLLGNTIESIAWNKAGIMKKGCNAFTVQQTNEAMEVLKKRSIEKKCSLEVITPHIEFENIYNNYPSDIFNMNASLALALCKAWITSNQNKTSNIHKLSNELIKTALTNCIWPGRYQIKQVKNLRFYLDGAHTFESVQVCLKWFHDMTKDSIFSNVLMFNVTGNRDATILLNEIVKYHFDVVIFVPNIITKCNSTGGNGVIVIDHQMERCQRHKQIWLSLQKQVNCIDEEQQIVEIFPAINLALEFLNTKNTNYNVLVSGSIHLIGNILSLLEPNLNEH